MYYELIFIWWYLWYWYLFQHTLKRVGRSLSYFHNHRNGHLSIRSESIVKHGLSQNRPLFDRKSVFGRTWQCVGPITHRFTNILAPLSNHANTSKLPPSQDAGEVVQKKLQIQSRAVLKGLLCVRCFAVICGLKLMKKQCKKVKKRKKEIARNENWKKMKFGEKKKYGFQGLTIIRRCHLKTAAAKWGFILINCTAHLHTSSGDSCVDDSDGANRIDVTHFFLFYFFFPRVLPLSPPLLPHPSISTHHSLCVISAR